MIGYVMVGTNNLSASVSFYDKVLEPLGLIRVYIQKDMAAYASKARQEAIEFYVCKPYNKEAATSGNGTMIAFKVETREVVKRFHVLGLLQGGKNEGEPGARPAENDPYYAYLRDLDGNKICVFCSEYSSP